ncbi:phosphotransferase family protein [Streptomyces sp. 8N616]|uniref:phosphotransferase family protein n=1 Tax=Streptomyces sp. 8N616 TaxID=3457414 RepID=UPI003FD30AFC
MGTSLAEQLAAFGRGAEAARRGLASCPLPAARSGPAGEATGGPAGEATVVADRPDGTVVRIGPVVSKAHAPGSDPAALAARLRIAAHPRLGGVLLPPLPVSRDGDLLGVLHDGRPATLWPAGEPVSPDEPDAAPWEEAAVLLARLHSVPPAELAGPVPPMRGPAKAARAIARLRAAAWTSEGATERVTATATERGSGAEPGPATVLRAWDALPPWARGEAPPPRARALCHGDWHLGQLVRHPAFHGPWLLIDVDDLGIGDPAWDLARPAAWFAVGLLAPGVWQRFLDAYRSSGGPAVRPEGDPWPELDVPARALTVQSAALALAKAPAGRRPLDEAERALLDACARMAGSEPGTHTADPEPGGMSRAARP